MTKIADGEYFAILATPKPEPVLMEAWVNLYSDRRVRPQLLDTRARADERSIEGRVECRRIAWMSDGSPVPASPEQFDQMREMAKLITDRDHWKAKAESLQAEMERDQLRAVLEAIATHNPAVTHGWAEQVREMARRALGQAPERTGAVIERPCW